ncbi:MAG: secreted glycosyl hydrolase [Fibrobacteres bacterium]|nr:secreted glycosyl hydrolase [Fibrobacterota bacterium]
MRLGAQTAFFGLMMGLASSGWSVDLGTYKGCAATDNDFAMTKIFQGPVPSSGGDNSANSVLKVSFDAQPNNVVDVYFIQKWGAISRYNGAAKTVDVLGTLNANHKGEQGLIGIALDPNFKTNRYIYVNYSFVEAGNTYAFRISRFTLGAGAAGKIDMASEKILIKIPCQNNDWHTAGAMLFDAYGDLFCNIGDNQQSEGTAGNTADLRGGIIRIHPDDSPKGYSIPKGNFGEVMAASFKTAGNTTVAAQYADTSMVKAEIFVKGTRNAYTLGMDPVRRWIAWGEVGPDQGKVSEEYNMVKAPVFGGWPYFAGAENMGAGSPSGGPAGGPYGTAVPLMPNPNAIMNNFAGIKGVKTLPPNHNPIFVKNQSCAMGGPIFVYDGANTSSTQFPPQFNHKWILSDCNGSGYGYRLLSFDAAGDTVVGGDALKIFAGANAPKTVGLVDMKQGPDGSLYIVDWGGGAIYRMDYTGTCKDATLLKDKTGCADATAKNYDASIPAAYNDPRLCQFGTSLVPGRIFTENPILVSGRTVTVSLQGGYELRVLDVSGRVAYSMSGEGNKTYALPGLKQSGVYHVEVKGSEGVFTSRLLNVTP